MCRFDIVTITGGLWLQLGSSVEVSVMAVVVGLAVGLIVVGLAICWLSRQAGNPTLANIFWWAGVILAVVGLILLIAPVLNWISVQLRTMLAT